MELATLILIAAVFLAVILILLLARNDSGRQDRDRPKPHRPEFKPPEIIPPERRAGIRGEAAAEELIRSVLRPEDTGRAVHTWGRNRLNLETVERIKGLLE